MARQFLTPVGLPTGSALPSTGTTGNLFYLTTDSKVYQYNGSAWLPLTPVPAGGTSNQVLTKTNSTDYAVSWQDVVSSSGAATQVHTYVKNGSGGTLTKGTAVYVLGADGTNVLVGAADNSTEATSSKTLGLLEQDLANNAFGYVANQGLLGGLNTGTATAGDPVWLGTSGALIFGLANKPVAPAHLVYLGVVTKANSSTGEIYVLVQNGFELNELHNVLLDANASIADNEVLAWDSASSLWKNQTSVEANLAQLSGGNALTGAQTVTTSVTTDKPLVVNGPSGVSVNLQEWQVNGSVLASIGSAGAGVFSGVGVFGAQSNTPNAQLYVLSNSTGNPVAVVKGAASQTGNLQEWQTNTPTTVASVSAGGAFSVLPSSGVALFAKGDASSSDIIQAQINGAATNRFIVNTTGRVAVGSPATVISSSALSVSSMFATNPALVLQGVANQTSDLAQYQNSSGTVLAAINAAGQFFTGSTTSIKNGTTAVTAASASSATAATYTIGTVSAVNPVAVGQLVTTAGFTAETYYNGTFAVTAIGGSSGAWTFTVAGSGFTVGSATVMGTYTIPVQLSTTASSAGTTPLVIRGATSQANDYMTVQNSAGTTIGAFTSGGSFYVNGQLRAGGSTSFAQLSAVASSATTVGFGVRGVTSQSADLAQYQNTSATVLGGRNANGQIYTGVATTMNFTAGGATTATSGDGTTATITTTSAHNLQVGDLAVVAGVTPTGYNGTYPITAVTTNTISYLNATTGAQTVAGTVSVPAQLSVNARSVGTPAMYVNAPTSMAVDIARFTIAYSTVAKISSAGNVQAVGFQTLPNSYVNIKEAASGGQVAMTRQTSQATNPGANYGMLYFRDGTTAGTLKLVSLAGASGTEEALVDNINTNGTASALLAVKYIDGGSA